jgi:hypothetical protein
MSSDARHTGFALEETTISTIHQAIQRRELTVRELVTGYLHRIEQHDKAGATLNAVVSLNEQALLEADALDAAFSSSQQLQQRGNGAGNVVGYLSLAHVQAHALRNARQVAEEGAAGRGAPQRRE